MPSHGRGTPYARRLCTARAGYHTTPAVMNQPFRAVVLAHWVYLAALSAYAALLRARTQARNPTAQRAAWVVRFDRRMDELAAIL